MEINWIPVLSLLFCAAAVLLYKYLQNLFDYWRVRGVPYIKPNWIFGNSKDVALRRLPIGLYQLRMYEQLAPHKYGGLFVFQRPVLMIRDPEMVKKVLTKDFRYFHHRGVKVYHDIDPLSRHLFLVNGEQWKNLRMKITTTFTGGKIKAMIPLIEECALELVAVLGDVSFSEDDYSGGGIDFEAKDFFARYVIDNIGSCAFGFNIGSLRNADSEFFLKSKKVFEFRYKAAMRTLFPNLSRKIIKMFDMKFVSKDMADFFTSLVKDMVEYREKNKVVRNDFLNLLINMKNNFNLDQARKKYEEIDHLEKLVLDGDDKKNKTTAPSNNIEITLDVIASQCFLFLGGGFETTASTMSFLLFEVAHHPEVQQKLKTEIDEVLMKHDQQITYEALKGMKYLDMVLAETLRLYAPAPVLFRSCTADYKLEDSDLIISKGTQVLIPVVGFHHDEQYYRNPKQFDPTNFEEDVKQQRHPYAYLPFGDGPRVCIAERFAKLQIKMAIVHLMKNYEFRLSPKMKLPIQLVNNTIGLTVAKDGVLLRCYSRKPKI